jgi:hypothetical protein
MARGDYATRRPHDARGLGRTGMVGVATIGTSSTLDRKCNWKGTGGRRSPMNDLAEAVLPAMADDNSWTRMRRRFVLECGRAPRWSAVTGQCVVAMSPGEWSRAPEHNARSVPHRKRNARPSRLC